MTCPDENLLARLLDGTLPAAGRVDIERHLDGCASCSGLVTELAAVLAPEPGGFTCDRCGERYPAPGLCPDDGGLVGDTRDPLIGTDVGRYRVARVLGTGGMSRVYAAFHRDLRASAALKVIGTRYADDAELARRFMVEARAVSMIRHDNIVKILDLLRLDDGRPVIVMELLEGQTLRQAVRAGELTSAGIVQVMIDVLAALSAAHAAGIVHRDLKPDNILIEANGRPKVLDFGIAKLHAAPADPSIARTRTGVLLGTPEYMAPEQIRGGDVDARSDLYSAGIVLFEAFAGRRPFVAGNDFELMRAHLEDPVPSLRALRSDVPAALEDVIRRALAKDPRDRFASASEMAQALREAIEERAAPARPRRRRRRIAVVVGGLSAVVAASVIALVTHGGPAREAEQTMARDAAAASDAAALRVADAAAPTPAPAPVRIAAGSAVVQPPQHHVPPPSPSPAPASGPAKPVPSGTVKVYKGPEGERIAMLEVNQSTEVLVHFDKLGTELDGKTVLYELEYLGPHLGHNAFYLEKRGSKTVRHFPLEEQGAGTWDFHHPGRTVKNFRIVYSEADSRAMTVDAMLSTYHP